MNRIRLILVLCFAGYCRYALADDHLKLDKTTILGNGELPKVTFVLPWRDAASSIPEWELSPVAHPLSTPLDSQLYHRQVEYLRQLNKTNGRDAAR